MSKVQSRHSQVQRDAVFRLRAKRKSLDEIARELGLPKSTVHYWLTVIRPSPLSLEELKQRRRARDLRYSLNAAERRKSDESKYHIAVKDANKLTRAQKCGIAEAAVLFRLALHGYRVFQSVFDGDKADWLIGTYARSGEFKRIQVKWMRRAKYGRPVMATTCTESGARRRYHQHELDALVGYDLFSDVAYVFRPNEMKRVQQTARPSAAEAWHKLLD